MKIKFSGIEPQARYYRMGVMLNNLTDDIVFEVEAMQGDIDLTSYRPYIKIQKPDLSFVDKDGNLEMTPTDGGKILLRYKITRTIEQYHTLDMQLQFEDYAVENIAVWQSVIFNITFNATLPTDQTIERMEPTVLQDHERRLQTLEAKPPSGILEFQNRYDFPTVGKEGVVYIDKSENLTFRFDADEKIYYVVGSDYQNIKIINCNGGK